jgi:hypothetical protein
MKTNNFLLPHYFQKIGWSLFIFSFIYFAVDLYAFNILELFDQNYSRYGTMILYLLLIFSALFVAFAKEKIEDELIQNIRFTSIVITAYISFSIFMIVWIFYAINHAFRFLPMDPKIWIYLRSINPVTMFMLYVVIFRTRLFISKRGLKNEE